MKEEQVDYQAVALGYKLEGGSHFEVIGHGDLTASCGCTLHLKASHFGACVLAAFSPHISELDFRAVVLLHNHAVALHKVGAFAHGLCDEGNITPVEVMFAMMAYMSEHAMRVGVEFASLPMRIEGASSGRGEVIHGALTLGVEAGLRLHQYIESGSTSQAFGPDFHTIRELSTREPLGNA